MGYRIEQIDSDFRINRKHKENALADVKLFAKTYRPWWIDKSYVGAAMTLEQAMSACRWKVYTDENGDIVEIEFTGEKAGQDLMLFEAISKYVDHGCWIEMCGEDHCHFKWVFRDGKVSEKEGRVVYDE